MISDWKVKCFGFVSVIVFAVIFIANVPQAAAESFRVTLPGIYGSYKDYTNVSIWKLENGTIVPSSKEYFGGHQPPSDNATNMSVNASYLFQLTSGNMGQNFNCTVQTKSDYSWIIDPSCSSPYSSPECLGCQYIQAPPSDNYFHALPITHVNPEEQSYWQAYLLDKKGKNLLFRGPNPTLVKDNKEHFDFPGLLSVLKNRYKTQVGDGKFPDKFVFVDISLINSDTSAPPSSGNPSNGYVLNAEYRFFNSKITDVKAIPPADKYVNGTVTIPAAKKDGAETKTDGALLWWEIQPVADSAARLSSLVSKIGKMMDSNSTVPYLIYFHCISGCDRTGDVAVSYLLDHKKMNPKDAYNYGTTVFNNQGKQNRLTPHGTQQDPHAAWQIPLIKFCKETTKSGNNACRTGCIFETPAQFPPSGYYPWNRTSWGCDMNGKTN